MMVKTKLPLLTGDVVTRIHCTCFWMWYVENAAKNIPQQLIFIISQLLSRKEVRGDFIFLNLSKNILSDSLKTNIFLLELNQKRQLGQDKSRFAWQKVILEI